MTKTYKTRQIEITQDADGEWTYSLWLPQRRAVVSNPGWSSSARAFSAARTAIDTDPTYR